MNKKKLGILGGGQLGMFICKSAKKFGIQTSIFSTTTDFSAKEFCDQFYIGEFTDEKKIGEFLNASDFFTIETENIPGFLLDQINREKKLFPSANIIKIAQNRMREKTFLNSISGVETAKFSSVNSFSELKKKIKDFHFNAIIKSCEFGYDGKNQFKVNKDNILEFKNRNLTNYIIEEFLDYKKEISVIVAKNNNQMIFYPPVENIHKDSILKQTTYPASLNINLYNNSLKIAGKIAEKIGLQGVLAVEMFVLKNNKILVNELAPRPHNSGHWTIDSCKYSQYDNLILSIFENGPKDPDPQKNCKMVNIIGHEYEKIESLKKSYKCYDYLKKEIKPKRKMGHYIIFND